MINVQQFYSWFWQVFLVRLFQIQPGSGEVISIQPFSCLPVTVTLVPYFTTFPIFLLLHKEHRLEEPTPKTQSFFYWILLSWIVTLASFTWLCAVICGVCEERKALILIAENINMLLLSTINNGSFLRLKLIFIA